MEKNQEMIRNEISLVDELMGVKEKTDEVNIIWREKVQETNLMLENT